MALALLPAAAAPVALALLPVALALLPVALAVALLPVALALLPVALAVVHLIQRLHRWRCQRLHRWRWRWHGCRLAHLRYNQEADPPQFASLRYKKR